jgi:hypothetical protein
VASPTSLSHAAPSAAMADSWTRLARSRRIRSAIWSVQAAWITGIRLAGTTNTVRRMPSIRTSAPSAYSAFSTAARPAPVRAHAAR